MQKAEVRYAYRAADRVSQFLINEVIPGSSAEPVDVLFRTLLFKVFNRVSTWRALDEELGPLHASEFNPKACAEVLSRQRQLGRQVYSAAYIMPMPAMPGATAKHEAHLALLGDLLTTGTLSSLLEARSLREFLKAAGAPVSDGEPLPQRVLDAIRRAQGGRPPSEAQPDLEVLRNAAIPSMVASGKHHPAIELMCDAVATAMGAERVVFAGKGHFIAAAPGFAERLERFLLSASDRNTVPVEI